MTSLTLLRIKRLLGTYGLPIALGCALCGVVLLGTAGVAYSNPPTTEVTDHTSQQTVRSELHTSATVTGETSLYDAGTKLEDEPIYLLTAAPSPTVTQRTSLPDGQTVQATQRMELRYRASHDGSVFWEETQKVAHDETSVSGGELVTRTSLDVGSLRERIGEIQSEVGRAGTVRVDLLVTVSYETGQHSDVLSGSAPIRLSDSWYSIGTLSLERTHSTTETKRVTLPSRDSSTYLLPGALGIGLLALAGVSAVGHRRDFDDERLGRRIEELRYDEWISAGAVPESPAETSVAIDSLEGLVDVAIDTNNRIIHDERRGVYVVLDGSVTYHYSPTEFVFADFD